MGGSGLHRKGKRKRRHLGRKPSLAERLEQSRRDRGLRPTYGPSPTEKVLPLVNDLKKYQDVQASGSLFDFVTKRALEKDKKGRWISTRGFIKRIFNRKTGG
jgi:hypothetical protein